MLHQERGQATLGQPVIFLHQDLKRTFNTFYEYADQARFIQELCENLPVMAVQLRSEDGGRVADSNTVFMAIEALVGRASCAFWSLIIQANESWKGSFMGSKFITRRVLIHAALRLSL